MVFSAQYGIQHSVQPISFGAGGRALKSLQALWFAVESSAITGGG
jgi:hypothetical protein